jgi:hypothetical protein
VKVIVEIEYAEDGHCPDGDVCEAIQNRFCGCLMSEDINKPDEWALLLESIKIEIKR